MARDIPDDAPLCAPADRNTRTPNIVMPRGACDTHAHVCGLPPKYEYVADRLYIPHDETWLMYRAVLPQPSVYGSDNSALVDALAAGGDAELKRLDKAGIRGIRINIADRRDNRNILVLDQLMPLAKRIAPLGCHIEFQLQADAVPDLAETCARLPVPVVLGHLGYVHADKGGADHPGFPALLRWLDAGQCWVKLTAPCRISGQEMPYPNVAPMAHALVAAAPQRLLWGTDWPHVLIKTGMPNDGDIADLLLGWVPDEATRNAILVDNPQALYGFAQV